MRICVLNLLVWKVNNFDLELLKKYVSPEKYDDAVKKLNTGYPVQYIIGNVEFYGLLINVNEDVLIPRFETEYLVQDVIELTKTYSFVKDILDIGTGSGCIALALKKNIDADVDAIDISKEALEVAKANARLNHLDINFSLSSIENFNSIKKYDLLISNPPYVSFSSPVSDNIKYEPRNAIYAPEDGLYYYRIILEKCPFLLNKQNIIAFEIGDKEKDAIISLAKKYYPNGKYISKNDLNGYERYLYIINE